jgi:[ribosomal protein S18]-alanine N-acetyltransferase
MDAKPSGERTIRAYRAEDRQAVVAMLVGRDPWQRLGYAAADWERLLAVPLAGREGWVIERSAQPAGFALLRVGFLLGDYLELFVVAADDEGTGLGRELLEAVEQAVFARSRNLFVCVSDFNTAARRFYEHLGYQDVGLLPDLLVAGSAERLLRKTTGPARAR